MSFHMSRRSIPELAALSRKECNEVIALTRWKPFRYWQFWLFVVLWVAFASWLLRITTGKLDSVLEFAGALAVVYLLSHPMWVVKLHFQLPYIRESVKRQAEPDNQDVSNPAGRTIHHKATSKDTSN